MRKLFQAGNDVTTIGRVRSCKITMSLVKENKHVTPELEKLVLKCLAKDPKERYQTADDMEKAIRKFLYANYSDFSAGELGKFLKERLSSKRKQMRKNLKTMLSQSSPPSSSKPKLELDIPNKNEKAPSLHPVLPSVDGNTVIKAKKPPPAFADISKRKKEKVFSSPASSKSSPVEPLLKDLSDSIKEIRKESPALVAYGVRRKKRRRKV